MPSFHCRGTSCYIAGLPFSAKRSAAILLEFPGLHFTAGELVVILQEFQALLSLQKDQLLYCRISGSSFLCKNISCYTAGLSGPLFSEEGLDVILLDFQALSLQENQILYCRTSRPFFH